ncbi:MAG: carboxypeptidase regulatory-like domain-containing protein, partial [Acidobacteriaceae bacterium]
MKTASMVGSRFISLVLVLLFFSFTAVSLWAQAQNTSQIQGTITDTSGAVIAGAQIKATQTDTDVTRTVTAGTNGTYVLPNLPIGPYRLDVSASGFNTYVRTGIVLQVATNPTINVSLQVGAVNQQIEVHANALQASTEATGIGTVMEQQRIVELPLNGRLATDLLQYTPAVIPQGMSGNRGFPGVQSFVVNGGQAFGNAFWLDGSNYNDPYDSGNLAFPFPDALQEFKVETSSLTAQNGVQAGATVTAVTKSGTNRFHGDAFEFFRNGDLNARNYFSPTRDTLKRNQFGGVLGGPIKKDKLFFFFGYQNTITRQDPASTTSFVPTTAMLQGDFSACPADIPAAVAGDFVNDKIDPSLYDAASLKLAALLPVGNAPCGSTTFGL